MPLTLLVLGVVVSSLASLVFSSLTFSLRDFSRSVLEDYLTERGDERWLGPTFKHRNDLIVVTATGRLFANIGIVVFALVAVQQWTLAPWLEFLVAVLVAGVITLLVSVTIPHAIARYVAEPTIGRFVPLLHTLRISLLPVVKLMGVIDSLVRRVTNAKVETEPQLLEQEILEAVEEGAKEGIVDEQEKEMIESVIEFRDTQVGQTMTARPEIIGIELKSTMIEIKSTVEESGHSRIPVYDGTLDHIVGILYARDLIKHLGLPPEKFDIRSAIRAAFYVPETKPLRELLRDFRLQKVHIAIVLDEYGGTAGLVTIEDILEELVGEISDEHEPHEPAMFVKHGETTAEVDARIYIDELNRNLDLHLPDDAGYDTLSGFITTTLGHIPETGETFEHAGVKYTIIDAEPHKVNRVKIDMPETEEVTEEAPSGK